MTGSGEAPRKRVRRSRPVAVVGWNEHVDLPEWKVRGLRAKIDTGARTSSIHVENIAELPRGRVRFDVVLDRDGGRCRHVTTAVTRRARVRSSTGKVRLRIFVKTTLRIGPLDIPVELSLVDREKMIYRMLIGRSALAGRFLIDVGSQRLHGRPAKMRKPGRPSR